MRKSLYSYFTVALVLVGVVIATACAGPPAAQPTPAQPTAAPASAPSTTAEMPTADESAPGLAETVGAVATRVETVEALAVSAGRQAGTAQAIAEGVATSVAPSQQAAGTSLDLPLSIAIITKGQGGPQLHVFPVGNVTAFGTSAIDNLADRLEFELVISEPVSGTQELFYNEAGQLASAATPDQWLWSAFTSSTPLGLDSGDQVIPQGEPSIKSVPNLPLSGAFPFSQEVPITLGDLSEQIVDSGHEFKPVLIVYRLPVGEPQNQLYTVMVLESGPPGADGNIFSAWCVHCVDGFCVLICR